MTTFKSEFLRELSSRGFIQQTSEPAAALDALAQAPGLTAYIGFDCTAPSLHVGSLIQIMMLYWLQHYGHRPIALMGGGTTRVGDPSGKDESRRLLTDDDIAANLAGIRAVFERFHRFANAQRNVIFRNNADWLDSLKYIKFLRDVGRNFSVNRMLAFDSVKLRLDRQQELSFLEFNYMILQAYDFVELYERDHCMLQMGGSDQWGNIVNGIELGRRMKNAQLFGLTTQLIATSSGAKMGKTAAGTVWLDPEMTSPYDYWQYWRNREDSDVVRFLKLFTVLPLDEIERLARLQGQEINDAKKVLATEATALVHGRAAAIAAAATAGQAFQKREFGPMSITVGSPDMSSPNLTASMRTFDIPRDDLDRGVGVLTAFANITQLVSSKREARDRIKQGGLRVNDRVVVDEHAKLTWHDVTTDGVIKLSRGKQDVLLRPVGGAQD